MIPLVGPRLLAFLVSTLSIASAATLSVAAPASDGATADEFPFHGGFPFHIPATGTQPGTAPYDLIHPAPPAQADTPIKIYGDQFIRADTGKPFRFWGTNLNFSGCFPEHEIADRIAARMATLGINIVRFTHMDQRRFPGGIWHRDSPGASNAWNENNIAHETFDPEAVDRLDYFIASLKKRGIYTNLNLKVSRYITPDYDGPDFSQPGPNETYHKKSKGFDQFYTPAIAAQKDYARRLLTHRNPYTGLTYTEDPAVAIVEINNENGILWAWNYKILDSIPSRFIGELAARWNTWLRNQYSTTEALRAAWNPASGGSGAGVSPAGNAEPQLGTHSASNLLENIPPTLFTAQKARATLVPLSAADDADDSVPTSRRLTVTDLPGSTAWHVRCNYPVTLSPGATYSATLRLRANSPQKIKLRLRAPGDSKDIVPARTLNLATEWKNHAVTFSVPKNADTSADINANLYLEAGISGLVLDIDSASLTPGSGDAHLVGLPPGQGLISESGAGVPPAVPEAGETPASEQNAGGRRAPFRPQTRSPQGRQVGFEGADKFVPDEVGGRRETRGVRKMLGNRVAG
ncbi:hypothetical protein Ga0100231_000845 [Opitutaceae bacterium TAV4]|nr:hypothetical protein Ga0100230_011905 [Opitutaceae bacterium TAV3]RRK01393.1 hypothetical protein Ga0100231_000845 [Opitutaceae bacterium TAV4]